MKSLLSITSPLSQLGYVMLPLSQTQQSSNCHCAFATIAATSNNCQYSSLSGYAAASDAPCCQQQLTGPMVLLIWQQEQGDRPESEPAPPWHWLHTAANFRQVSRGHAGVQWIWAVWGAERRHCHSRFRPGTGNECTAWLAGPGETILIQIGAAAAALRQRIDIPKYWYLGGLVI